MPKETGAGQTVTTPPALQAQVAHDVTHPPRRPSSRWRRWLLDGVLFVVLVLAVGFWQTRHVPAGMAPAFSGPVLEQSETGANLRIDPPSVHHSAGNLALADWLARHPGRAVVIYFWADWCPICKLNEGAIDALRNDHPVLTVAMQSGNRDAVGRHLASRRLQWTTVVDDSGDIASRYGLPGVPAVIIIDRHGRIRFAERGYTSEWGIRWRLWWAGMVE